MYVLKSVTKKRSSSSLIAFLFLIAGVLALLYSVVYALQVLAFIGLGLVFWAAVFGLAREGKYVDSALLDGTAKSSYSTFDRVLGDLKFDVKGYYIPSYPSDVFLPEYLRSLRDPVVFVSDVFDGKPSIDEITGGKFLSEKGRGVFFTSPGSELVVQMEKRLNTDFSKVDFHELIDFLPRFLCETFSLAKTVDVSVVGDGVVLDASGIVYQGLYRADPPMKSVAVLGCPLVAAVASVLAKASGKTVLVSEQVLSPARCGVHVVYRFV